MFLVQVLLDRAYANLPQQGMLLKLVPSTGSHATMAPTRELDVANSRAYYSATMTYKHGLLQYDDLLKPSGILTYQLATMQQVLCYDSPPGRCDMALEFESATKVRRTSTIFWKPYETIAMLLGTIDVIHDPS